MSNFTPLVRVNPGIGESVGREANAVWRGVGRVLPPVADGVGDERFYRWRVTRSDTDDSPARPYALPFSSWQEPHPSLATLPAIMSACWSSLVVRVAEHRSPDAGAGGIGAGLARPWGVPAGSRLNLNLFASPAPGDFLPPSPTIGGGSVALVSRSAEGASAWWQDATRETLDGVVDLVTGVPLVQVSDLELPYGSSTFRLRRTRSHNTSVHAGFDSPLNSVRMLPGPDRWWDWTGQGWMISENPILLLDAAMADVTGDGPRTIWLWLDAHHSIPFQQVIHPAPQVGGAPTVTYEAPPRFRARIVPLGGQFVLPGTVDLDEPDPPASDPALAASDPQNVARWSVPPTQYEVYLYDSQLKYTFVAINEDVPPGTFNRGVLQSSGTSGPHALTSFHDRPFTRTQYVDAIGADSDDQRLALAPVPRETGFGGVHPWMNDPATPGMGVPRYALCVRMETKTGDAAEMACMPVRRHFADYTPPPVRPHENPLDAPQREAHAEYVQVFDDAPVKGAIRSIRLKTPDGVAWTLVYSYRRFFPKDDTDPMSGDASLTLRKQADWPMEEMGTWLAQFDVNDPARRWVQGFLAIDRIYAYRHDEAHPEDQLSEADLARAEMINTYVDGAVAGGQFRTDWLNAADAPIERLAASDASPEMGATVAKLRKWRHEIRYHYVTNALIPDNTQIFFDTLDIPSNDLVSNSLMRHAGGPPILIRTESRTRPEWEPQASQPPGEQPPAGSVITDNKVFVYDEAAYQRAGRGVPNTIPWLRMVFLDQDIADLTSRGWAGIPGVAQPASLSGLTLEALASQWVTHTSDGETRPMGFWDTDTHLDDRIAPFASLLFESSAWLPPVSTEALVDSQYGYLKPDSAQVWAMTSGTWSVVGGVAIRQASGVQRLFRISRITAPPPEAHFSPNGSGIPAAATPGTYQSMLNPMRSVYAHPYWWQASMGWPNGEVTIQRSLVAAPDMQKSRWISVIDEIRPKEQRPERLNDLQPEPFEHPLLTMPTPQNSGDPTLREGQISRRVVEMNPAGYVLRDRRWSVERGPDGRMVASGGGSGGLGVQHVYKTVRNVFATKYASQTPTPPAVPDSLVPPPRGSDKIAESYLDELLLVERRSVGWSAAEAMNQGETRGLIEFFEYAEREDELATGGSRVYVSAQGIQKGTGAGAAPPVKLYSGVSLRVESQAAGEGLFEAQINADFVTPRTDGTNQFLVDAFPQPESVNASSLATLAADYRVSVTLVQRRAAPDVPPDSPDKPDPRAQPPVWSQTIGPPRKLRPGAGAPWYFPVQRQWFDDEGRVTWSAQGLVRDPITPGSSGSGGLDALILTYTRFHDAGASAGQPWHVIVDAPGNLEVKTRMPAEFNIDAPAGPRPSQPAGGDVWAEGGAEWVMVPAHPAGWPRLGPGEAGKWVSSFTYDDRGVIDAFKHDGRRYSRRTWLVMRDDYNKEVRADLWGRNLAKTNEPYLAREWIFNDLVSTNPSGGPTGGVHAARTVAVCEILTYGKKKPEGQPQIRARVEWNNPVIVGTAQNAAADSAAWQATVTATGTGEDPPCEVTAKPYVDLTATRLGIDWTGRLKRAELLEWVPGFGWSDLGSKEINDLGEVYRELELDGSVTRIVKNPLGQELRRYAGTRDVDWPVIADPGAPQPAEPDFNMVLTDRTEYGSLPNDAWLPIISRKYTSSPSWARDFYNRFPGTTDPLPARPDAADLLRRDADGIPQVTTYDWRMRPVRVDSYVRNTAYSGTGEPFIRVGTTLTFLDHLSRERLVVTLGEGEGLVIPDAFNPAMLSESGGQPADQEWDFVALARAYLNGTASPVRPISVTSTEYQPDGTICERRTYDVGWQGTSGTPPYHAEYTYQGWSGQEVYSRRPGQPVRVSELDGLGRVKVLREVVLRAGGGSVDEAYELGRHETEYDWLGNVVETRRWERVKSDGVDELSPANAVCWRTWNWYDLKNRLIATADAGRDSNLPRPDAPQTGEPPVTAGSVFSASAGPERVPLWIYELNKAGQRIAEVSPAEVRTTNVYSGSGRLIRKVENDGPGVTEAAKRVTEYGYVVGKLAGIKVRLNEGSGTGSWQTTRVVHEAEVVEPFEGGYRLASKTRKAVGTMHMAAAPWAAPRDLYESDIQSIGANPNLKLRYTFDGLIAERIDARGVAFRYFYDDQRRLSRIQVGHYTSILETSPASFIPGMPAFTRLPGQPDDTINTIDYTYDASGRLQRVLATSPGAGIDDVVADTLFEYDARGNLLSDAQSIGKPADLGAVFPMNTPVVSYDWSGFVPTDPSGVDLGHERLVAMHYPPAHPNAPPRTVHMRYGATADGQPADPASGWMSRLSGMTTSVDDGLTTPVQHPVATFLYASSSRRLGTTLGADIVGYRLDDPIANSSGGDLLPGVDRLGRLAEMTWKGHDWSYPQGGTPAVMYGARYGYDIAGNRTSTRLTLRPQAGSPHTASQPRSSTYGYDALDRLINTQTGAMLETEPALDGAPIRTDAWSLDILGNWVGGAGPNSPPGRLVTGDHDAREATSLTHQVDNTNLIQEFRKQHGTVETIQEAGYDLAGNLSFDGKYAYVYDAWSRLVQINHCNVDQQLITVPPSGAPYLFAPTLVGSLVKRYTYDGLGRLVRTYSPWPSAELAVAGLVRSERFYYDGSRRIQEVVIDPIDAQATLPPWDPESGLPEPPPMMISGPFAPLDPSNPISAASLSWRELWMMTYHGVSTKLSREYVWGPGDSVHAGVDELLVQYDAWRDRPQWVLQDGSGDVVGVVKQTAGPVDHDNNAVTPERVAGILAGQYTYDAYGAVLSAVLYNGGHEPVFAGHKGLFFDNLDEHFALQGGEGLGATPIWLSLSHLLLGEREHRLVPWADPVYHVRNRAMMPRHGRWLQRDPNASGQVVAGETEPDIVDPEFAHADSFSLHAYVDGNPWTRRDPQGLFFSGGLIGTTIGMWNSATDMVNTGHMGNMMSFALDAMFRAHQMNALIDFELIADWSVPDEALSFHTSNVEETQRAILGMFWGDMARAGDELMSGVPSSPFEVFASTAGDDDIRQRERYIAALFKGRPQHGSAEHWRTMRREAMALAKKSNVDLNSIRINRRLPGDRRRPDISYDTVNKRTGARITMVLEVCNSETTSHAKEKWEKAPPGVKARDPVRVPKAAPGKGAPGKRRR